MSKIVISYVSLVNKKSSFIWTVKRGFSSIYIERDSIMNVDSMRWCCCAKVKPLQWVKHVTAKKRDFHYTRRRFSIIIFSCCCCFYRETLDKLMHWNGIRRRGLTFHLIDTKKDHRTKRQSSGRHSIYSDCTFWLKCTKCYVTQKVHRRERRQVRIFNISMNFMLIKWNENLNKLTSLHANVNKFLLSENLQFAFSLVFCVDFLFFDKSFIHSEIAIFPFALTASKESIYTHIKFTKCEYKYEKKNIHQICKRMHGVNSWD